MDIKKVLVDNRCLGGEMLCVGCKPYYAYTPDGQKGAQQGYTYDVCLPAHGFDKLGVKIEGDRQIEIPEGGHVAVTLTDLAVRPYVGRDGRLAFSASASAIKPLNNKG